MWFKKWRKSVGAIAIIAELPPTTQPCRTVTVLSCVHYPLEKNNKHDQKIVGRRYYVESLVRCYLRVKIYLCLPNIGALADHPSAKEGNSAKWTKKGFEKKENIFIDNLLMIRNLLLLLHK